VVDDCSNDILKEKGIAEYSKVKEINMTSSRKPQSEILESNTLELIM
jgi:hypothetical protein